MKIIISFLRASFLTASVITIQLISSNLSAEEVTEEYAKAPLLKEAQTNITEGLCGNERFLQCTGESAKVCHVKLDSVVLPKCSKAVFDKFPDPLTAEQGQKAAKALSECSAGYYVQMSKIDRKTFGLCMTAP